MSKYALWNKTDNIITPVGEVLSPEEWISRYPIAGQIDTVCGGGVINGAYFGIYASMIEMYENEGCDFSKCTSKQECLDAIEAFENERSEMVNTYVEPNSRIADALEDLVVMQELATME